MAHSLKCKIIRKAVTTHTPGELGFDVAAAVLRHVRSCPRCNWWYDKRTKRIEAAIVSAGIHNCEDARTVMEWGPPKYICHELREMVRAHVEDCPGCLEWITKKELAERHHRYN